VFHKPFPWSEKKEPLEGGEKGGREGIQKSKSESETMKEDGGETPKRVVEDARGEKKNKYQRREKKRRGGGKKPKTTRKRILVIRSGRSCLCGSVRDEGNKEFN